MTKITDEATLAAAADTLHDASFATRDIAYDATRQVFSLLLSREIPELARRRRVLPFLYRIDRPRRLCRLEIRYVKELSMKVTYGFGLGEYCLEEILYDQGKKVLRFEVMGPLKLELTLDDLCGELRDIGEEVNWEKSDGPWLELSWRP
jgi:hypothetical protein